MPESRHTPVAIITGAGSGVGRAIAALLAGKGYNLALAGRRQAALRETASIAERKEPPSDASVVVIPTDMSDPVQVRSLIDEALGRFGRVDALVNNAAIAELTPIDSADLEQLTRILKINTIGPAAAIYALWPSFRARGVGRVVNISTMGTLSPFPGLCAYAASKCALESLARSIAREAGDDDIRAYNVAPGAIETAMLRGIVSAEELPASQCLTPEDVAHVVVDLITGDRIEENGATIRMPNPPPPGEGG
jgi:NAD(P)-dependent dehydrogenase (short-subunit alcohol dehydrogenase family)